MVVDFLSIDPVVRNCENVFILDFFCIFMVLGRWAGVRDYRIYFPWFISISKVFLFQVIFRRLS